MRRSVVLWSLLLCGAGSGTRQAANAEITPNLPIISLKNDETLEVMDLCYAINCESQLKSAPSAEVMEDPSEVTITVKEAMIIPREGNCDKPINGGKLLVSAKGIENYSISTLTVRITYDTKDGERNPSYSFNVILFPKPE